MNDPHMVGFEKEALFRQARIECQKTHPDFKSKALKSALQIACPEFMHGLYGIRPCSRKLKFVGGSGEISSFFEYGKVYEAIDFNGGTYRINGYEDRIGAGYFEVCTD